MNCSKNKTSELHSAVFKTNPPNRWTTETSRKWLKDHGIERLKSVDKTKNSLRYRIVDPECFLSFSTKVVTSEMGDINLVIGWYVKRAAKAKKFKVPKRNLKKKGEVHIASRLRGKATRPQGKRSKKS